MRNTRNELRDGPDGREE
jgi:hypothetical protein